MDQPSVATPPVASEQFGRAVLSKVAWRLIPFVCLLYVFNILDRANVGAARIRMQPDLGMSDRVFDLGFGMFYVGYLLFEVPSNLLLRRFGARKWIARIMVSWGLVSMFTLAVQGPWTFYIVRIMLGIAEAGFFPGIVYYLTYWFPARERAKMTSYFMAAISLSSVFGNPLSGWIMREFNGALGWSGWQWLFLLEGIPSVILGFAALYWLTDKPETAEWMSAEEKNWLTSELERENSEKARQQHPSPWMALADWRVWLLIAIYSTVAIGANAGGAYFYKMVEENFPEADEFGVGLRAALPHICAVIGMTFISTSSDRTGERHGHVAFSALLGAAGWATVAFAGSPTVALIGICLAQTGMMSMLPIFWTLPTKFLSGVAAAAGIALINSVANIGGIFAATIRGSFGDLTIAAVLVVGAGLTITMACIQSFAGGDPRDRKEGGHA